MNIQEAYNKGLTDAEESLMKGLSQIIKGESVEDFNNPNVQIYFSILKEWADYYHESSKKLTAHGKKFKKMLDAQIEILNQKSL